MNYEVNIFKIFVFVLHWNGNKLKDGGTKAQHADNNMKRCPSCGEWNDDNVQRCWQCREVFDEITALRGKTPVEPVVEKKGKSGTVKWQTRLGEIWKENTVSIIITIISIALIFYAIVQKPHVDEITPPRRLPLLRLTLFFLLPLRSLP